jgi:hypothetical protein
MTTHLLTTQGERVNWRRLWAPQWRVLRPKVVPAWHGLLNVTRPARWALGLRRVQAQPVAARCVDSSG